MAQLESDKYKISSYATIAPHSTDRLGVVKTETRQGEKWTNSNSLKKGVDELQSRDTSKAAVRCIWIIYREQSYASGSSPKDTIGWNPGEDIIRMMYVDARSPYIERVYSLYNAGL